MFLFKPSCCRPEASAEGSPPWGRRLERSEGRRPERKRGMPRYRSAGQSREGIFLNSPILIKASFVIPILFSHYSSGARSPAFSSHPWKKEVSRHTRNVRTDITPNLKRRGNRKVRKNFLTCFYVEASEVVSFDPSLDSFFSFSFLA
jgi:hypothetical protein